MSSAMKTPASARKKNPSLMKVFKKGGKDAHPELPMARTAPNTPEEETGVTILANEVDPLTDPLSQLMFSPPSPLRGHHRSYSSKASASASASASPSSPSYAAREEKKEDVSPATVASDETVVDVVSKTLNFFDDMCQLPVGIAGGESEFEGATESSVDHPPLLTNESSRSGYDESTTLPSLRSEFSTADHTRTTNGSHTNSASSKPKGGASPTLGKNKGIPRSPSHDHENFEVVLDPASLLKDEAFGNASANAKGIAKGNVNPSKTKPTKAKRWPRLSKSLSSSLSAQRKEQYHNEPPTTGNAASPAPEPSYVAEPVDPVPLSVLQDLEMPMDEEMDRLLGTANSNSIPKPQHDAPEEGGAPESGGLSSTAVAAKEVKSSSSGGGSSSVVVGPKVLAKKIWKKAKKIGQHGEKKQPQSHHHAEVDTEAAVARRSMERHRKNFEEQDFLNQGCPKQDVEPILEENESDIDGDIEPATRKSASALNESELENEHEHEPHASSMANAWNNIFTSITNSLDPELSGADACGVTGGSRNVKALVNSSTDSSNLNSSTDSSNLSLSMDYEGDETLDTSGESEPNRKPVAAARVEAPSEAQQQQLPSVEVSNDEDPSDTKKAKASPSKTFLLGSRLKKIQKNAYFKRASKAKGKSKQSNESNRKGAQQQPESQSPAIGTKQADDSSPVSLVPPKVTWKAVVDPNSGRTYYYHRKTRETTWTKPEEFKQYQMDYKKWLRAMAAATPAEREAAEALAESCTARAAPTEETKEEEKPSDPKATSNANAASACTPSWPGSGETTDGTADEDAVPRTSSNALERCVMLPLQMTDNTSTDEVTKSKSEQGTASKKIEPIPEESANEDHEKEETEEVKGKAKETVAAQNNNKQQPFDESKPFDESTTPFDEPMADTGPGLLFLPRSPKRLGRTMTYMSKASARSALTDRTEKIKNTGKGKFSAIRAINGIGNRSAATSISSYDQSHSPRVPSRVPVVRERQLMVEELTDARISAESYEGVAGEKRGRIVKGRARDEQPNIQTRHTHSHAHAHTHAHEAVLYDGDNDTQTLDDYAASTFDNETYGTDSVSALSENDTDFLSRRDNFDQARRRALDAAIEIEDWDLAAALTDGMRAANLPGGYERAHSSWNQSELDKFIANNDWTAVKSYIAKMREKQQRGIGMSSRRKGHGHASSANKRVGSRSQIQHRDIMSEDSWSGSDSESSYETYDSESQV
eukprot:jgi/Psemu1/3448/gm1.3448_g